MPRSCVARSPRCGRCGIQGSCAERSAALRGGGA
ncbi:MAG: hypothetical protein IJI06_00375 [Oscillospiraceae bacterium]|nr:hypothetical protein [Oscillospiraceae bacterium]